MHQIIFPNQQRNPLRLGRLGCFGLFIIRPLSLKVVTCHRKPIRFLCNRQGQALITLPKGIRERQGESGIEADHQEYCEILFCQ
jgi:hypothetical protein